MRYVLAWVLAGALGVGAAVLALGGDGGGDGPEGVTVPPVQEVELATAARRAGCDLRQGDRGARGLAVAGRAGPAVRPGAYPSAPPDAGLLGALRRGAVVIHHRPGLPAELVERLDAVRRAVPRGTVLVGNPRMRFAVAVTAWRRLLGCRSATGPAADAIQLFRGRYLGSGPDAPP